MLVGEAQSQAPECFPLGAGERDRTHLFDQGDGWQQDTACAQFVRHRVREDHPLGRLQGERHQPVDHLPVITAIKLPQLEPVE